MHHLIGQQSLTSGWLPVVAQLITVVGVAAAIGFRPRRWSVRWAPGAALVGVACAAAVEIYVGSMGVAGGPVPRRLLCWVGLTGFAGVVAVAGWRSSRWWRRGITVVSVPACVLCTALVLNQWVGYLPTVHTAWNQLTIGPLPDQTDRMTVTAMQLTGIRPSRGAVVPVTISDKASRFRHRDELIYLPPAYFANPPPRLPVVMMIGAQLNTPEDWLRAGGAVQTIDDFAIAHGGNAPVLVFVDATGAFDNDTECVNGRRGNAAFHLTKDVVPYMVSNFGVSSDRNNWAVLGWSMGGTCALDLTVRRPELFSAFVDIAGDAGPNTGDKAQTVARLFGGDTNAWAAFDPATVIERHGQYSGVSGLFEVAARSGAVDGPDLSNPEGQDHAADALSTLGAAHGVMCSILRLSGRHDWPFAAQALVSRFPGWQAEWARRRYHRHRCLALQPPGRCRRLHRHHRAARQGRGEKADESVPEVLITLSKTTAGASRPRPRRCRTMVGVRTSAVMSARRTLIVVDPGRVRLRAAAATTASLILAIAAMLAITRAAGEPVTVVMLGAVVAMQSSAAVKDRDQRSRNITTVLMCVPSIGAVALAAALSPYGKIADIGFIAVLFGAVWLRRYGPRGNALGMVAFISYFFALFLRATLPQVPGLAVAVAVGVAASLLVHIVIFPERPRAEARRLLSALRAASTAVLNAATTPERDDVDGLRRRLDQLGETALLIDDWLDRHDAAASLSVTSKDLALRVFEAQIMMEQLAVLVWTLNSEQPRPHGLDDAVAALRICLTDDPDEDDLHSARRQCAAAAERADLSDPAGLATVAAFRTMQAHLAIHHITSNALGADNGVAAAPEEDAEEQESSPGLHPSTKAAIQVTIATSAATILGELISPNRWYWAVLTAFLVFTGVTTRGELLSRAGHRIVGTLAGVAAGVLLAALIGQRPPLQILVLLACVFCAFYLAAVSYVWLTFFTTVLLAMLYGLLGTFSLEVLELRIAETAVGALVGIASAYFVFSTKTRATLVEKVENYFDQLDDIIDVATDSVCNPGRDTDLVADTRRLDNALQDAVSAGKPLQLGPTADLRQGVRRLLRGLQIGNRSAHALARAGVVASRADADSKPPQDTAEAVRHAASRAHTTVADIRQMMAGEAAETSEKRSDMAIFDMVGVSQIPPGPVRAAVRAINTLDRVLAEVTVRA